MTIRTKFHILYHKWNYFGSKKEEMKHFSTAQKNLLRLNTGSSTSINPASSAVSTADFWLCASRVQDPCGPHVFSTYQAIRLNFVGAIRFQHLSGTLRRDPVKTVSTLSKSCNQQLLRAMPVKKALIKKSPSIIFKFQIIFENFLPRFWSLESNPACWWVRSSLSTLAPRTAMMKHIIGRGTPLNTMLCFMLNNKL